MARPRLDLLLTEALGRRLTIVVADAGFGKTTTLAGWAAGTPSAWYTVTPDDRVLATLARGLVDALRLRLPALPADLAGILAGTRGPDASGDESRSAQVAAATLAQALDESLTRGLLVVLDDVHELGDGGGSTAFLESLALQAPPGLHLVVASRREPQLRVDRLRGQGQVLDVDAADLRLDADEVAGLIEAVGTTTPPGAAAAIHEACSGWPAAVRLAIEALGRAPAEEALTVLERLRRPGGSLYGYLAAEVLALESPDVRRLVQAVAPIGRFTPELCEALGIDGAGALLAALARSGVFVEPRGRGVGWYSLTTPVREYALASLPLDDEERARLCTAAASWLEEHGAPDAALAVLVEAADDGAVARLLERHGQRLLATGAVATLERALEAVPEAQLTPSLFRLAGDVRQRRGDWDGAITCYEGAAAPGEPLSDDVAWRLGLIHHLRGHLDEALRVYRAVEESTDASRDRALLLAWRASALWLRGEIDECRADADAAFAAASKTDDPQALAAAHTVLAMLAAVDGDRGGNDAHYLRALDYAERAGDVLQLIRVRTNRGSRHLEEGAYEAAIEELEHALRLADLAGFASFRALALTNRGEAQFRLGRLEEAVADLESARQLYQRLGSRLVSYPLEKVGSVYRERGAWALARAAFEQAIAQAEAASDRQGLVPA
ncbi:MAG: tetratricopeptide repeat protein, partial [Thermoleophilia bacterium]|nr:tetratricopeptide repeat protein [Thermoleophilia bacterium]